MKIEKIRKLIGREEIDYSTLLSLLKEYRHPRDKITHWLKSKELIRVKKGLYIFGKEIALQAYSKEVLANLIYGPSVISLHYALSFYGLIPERVSVITSITFKRFKKFSTPVGEFVYYYLPIDKYAMHITLQQISNNQPFLIVTREKALCDYIYLFTKKISLPTLESIENYLFHDLRLDPSAFKLLNIKKIAEINALYQNEKIQLLINFYKKRKH